MWHLSALIVEEYGHFRAAQAKVKDSDEFLSLAEHSPEMPTRSHTAIDLTSRFPPLRHSLEPSSSRTRSLEDQVSFEPRAESARNSLEGDRHRNIEGLRGHKYWSPGQAESASIYSVLSGSSQQNPPGVSSPASSHRHIRGGLTRKVPRHTPNGSDDALSSARNSVSDLSDQYTKPRRRTVDPDSRPDSGMPSVNTSIKLVVSSDSPVANGSGVHRSPLYSNNIRESDIVSDSEPIPHALTTKQQSRQSSSEDGHRVFSRRQRFRTSLHSSDQLSTRAEHLHRQEADEEKTNDEYLRKAL